MKLIANKDLVGTVVAVEGDESKDEIVLVYADGRRVEITSCWGDYGVGAFDVTKKPEAVV